MAVMPHTEIGCASAQSALLTFNIIENTTLVEQLGRISRLVCRGVLGKGHTSCSFVGSERQHAALVDTGRHRFCVARKYNKGLDRRSGVFRHAGYAPNDFNETGLPAPVKRFESHSEAPPPSICERAVRRP